MELKIQWIGETFWWWRLPRPTLLVYRTDQMISHLIQSQPKHKLIACCGSLHALYHLSLEPIKWLIIWFASWGIFNMKTKKIQYIAFTSTWISWHNFTKRAAISPCFRSLFNCLTSILSSNKNHNENLMIFLDDVLNFWSYLIHLEFSLVGLIIA